MGTAAIPRYDADLVAPMKTLNAEGPGPFALVCDHASNRIPPQYDDLSLSPSDRIRHIAWDPGALAVSLRLTELLDAPLVHSTVSRLVIDCNRAPDSETLIATVSEATPIPANHHISSAERAERVFRYHRPFHEATEALLAKREAAGLETILVCIHSFTPVFHGVRRPWPVGVLPPGDERFSRALHEALCDEVPEAEVGWNEPYATSQGFSFTVEHHGRGRDAAMIEIRHDEILEPSGVALWADRLARTLEAARMTRRGHAGNLSLPRRGGMGLEGRD
jgi:predicted N-formylglutamate amidohydrolase